MDFSLLLLGWTAMFILWFNDFERISCLWMDPGNQFRFYIMHLEKRRLKFSNITHHTSVTQCPGSIGGHAWYLGVAKPSIVSPSGVTEEAGKKNVRESLHGHLYVPPSIDDLRVFRIKGSKFVKLHVGTWHAWPLFRAKTMDFYNLELCNTNIVDHTVHSFLKDDGVVFLFDK